MLLAKKTIMFNTKKFKRDLYYKIPFGYWLAGLIDGDGYLGVSNKNYTSCEITVGLKELILLERVFLTLSGKITLRTETKSYRWRLHNKKDMGTLVKYIKGKCPLPSKKIQLENVCKIVEIPNRNIHATFPGEAYWVSESLEAETYFNVNTLTLQCSVTLSQKTPELLYNLKDFIGGNVYYDKSWNGYLYSASDTTFLDNWFTYLSNFPLLSRKKVD